MSSFAKFAAVFAAAASIASVANAAPVVFKDVGGSVTDFSGSPSNYTAMGTSNGVGVDSNASGELSVREIAQAWQNLVLGSSTTSSWTFTRIYDYLGTPGTLGTSPNIGGSPAGTNPSPLANFTDAVWADGTVNVDLKAKYAGDNQYVGSVTSGSTFNDKIFIAGGNTATLTNQSFVTGGTPFKFGRSSTNSTTASQLSDQSPDRMITFLVTGDGLGTPTYAIFFEDRNSGDGDFNDAAIMFSGRGGGPIIPLPGASLMGMALLGGLGLTRARRALA